MSTAKLKARLLKAGVAMATHNRLKQRVDALWAEVKTLLREKSCGICYSEWDHEGNPCYSFEIPLGDYLALFPDEKPTLAEYEYNGSRKATLQYPNRYVGQSKQVYLFVSARTPSVTLGSVADKPEQSIRATPS